MLKDLAAAFDAYVELSANLQEGTKVCYCLKKERLNFYFVEVSHLEVYRVVHYLI